MKPVTASLAHMARFPSILEFVKFVATFLLIVTFTLTVGTAQAATSMPAFPLSTSGNKIVDANGFPVTLQGVNWFGFETANHVPHGLWTRDYKDMLKQISLLGFNVIRLPFSLQALNATTISGIDYGSGKNAALQGKTPQQVMDIIIDEAAKNNLMVILDNHSQADDGFMFDLWYGQNGFTENDWVARWETLATRYANKPNVIGADLKNEPHGSATWGTDAANDWRKAAERAGNAILAKNGNWLIFVEGIEGQVAGGQQLQQHWWGGNLEGVRNNPVRLNKANKLVYSPHEYGPSVFAQPWFSSPDLVNILSDRWSKGFGYINDQNTAPILVGEFGAKNVGLDTVEGRWFRQFTNYMSSKGINWTFWSWNPNSGDTGGVLNDDWQTIHTDKMAVLTALINKEAIQYTGTTPAQTPTPAPTPTPTPTPAPTPPPSNGSVIANLAVDSNWGSGWCGKLTVANGSSSRILINSISFDLPAAAVISSIWNGSYTRVANRMTVTTPTWAAADSQKTFSDTGLCVNSATLASGFSVIYTTADGTVGTIPMPPPPTTTPPPANNNGGLQVTFLQDSTWNGGYCRSTAIKNTGSSIVHGWTLKFTLPTSVTITQNWSGTMTRSGTSITVKPPTWGIDIGAGQSVNTWGFCAGGSTQPSEAVATSP